MRTGNHCLRIEATPPPASLSPNQIEKYAFVVVSKVRQVVGEVREVVANADLQVLADVTIDRSQRTTATLTDIRQGQHSRLGQAFPVLAEPPVRAQHPQSCRVVEELPLLAI